jgi:hypothetical protein
MLMAAFEEFSTFHFILINSRWAGAPTQKQALREYLRGRMWAAVRRLSVTADVLSEVTDRDHGNSGGGRWRNAVLNCPLLKRTAGK